MLSIHGGGTERDVMEKDADLTGKLCNNPTLNICYIYQ